MLIHPFPTTTGESTTMLLLVETFFFWWRHWQNGCHRLWCIRLRMWGADAWPMGSRKAPASLSPGRLSMLSRWETEVFFLNLQPKPFGQNTYLYNSKPRNNSLKIPSGNPRCARFFVWLFKRLMGMGINPSTCYNTLCILNFEPKK